MHPISELLCEAYSELHRQGQVSFPLQEAHRSHIDSIVKTVHSTFFGVERFPRSQDKAIAYLYLIIKDHPVVDGNKRLAVLWFEIYCTVLKLSPDYSRFTLDQIAVAVEKSTSDDSEQMQQVLKILLFGVDA